MQSKQYLTILLLVLFSALNATTIIDGGDISGIWHEINEPFYIDANFNIPENETLYVEPGCEIIFRTRAQVNISRHAALVMEGSEDDSIFITAFVPARFDDLLDAYTGGFRGFYINRFATLNLAYCHVTELCDTTDGSGIFADSSSSLRIQNTYFGNSKFNHENASLINSFHSNLNIISSEFTLCDIHNPTEYGAVIFMNNSEISNIQGSLIYSNNAHAIRATNSSFNISNSEIFNNIGYSADIANCDKVEITNSKIHENQSNLTAYNSTIYLHNNIFRENTSFYGGAFYSHNSNIISVNNTIVDNYAVSSGGGIFCEFGTKVFMLNTLFYRNVAWFGNDIYNFGAIACTTSVYYSNLDTSGVLDPYEPHSINGDSIYNYVPNFIDFDSYDYHLSEISPLLQKGSGSMYIPDFDTIIVPLTFDFDSMPRPIDRFEPGAFEYIPENLIEYEIYAGWNLLSWQFNSPDLNPNDYSSIIGDAFLYNSDTRAYDRADSIGSGSGFWLLSDSDIISYMSGDRWASSVTYILYPGWNLVGAPNSIVSLSTFEHRDAIIMPIYEYDNIDRAYIESVNISPGQGYWILSTDTIHISIP